MSTKEKRPAPRRTASKSRTDARRQQTGERSRKARPGRSTAPKAAPVRQVQKTAAKTQRPARPVRRKTVRRAESQVVYTPPKSFNKYHFLLSIIGVAAVVLALTLSMSIFFKVENIYVAGMEKYTAWDIREASGIQEGENLLTLGKAKVGGKIIAGLPYVEKVRVGIKLPDTVNIEVEESDVTYAIQAEDSGWWFINSQGRVLEMTTGIIAEYFTKVEGVRIAVPEAGQQAVAATTQSADVAEATADTTAETEAPTAPVDTVNGADQLTVALAILQNLEKNGVVGEVTGVNVEDLYNLELTYEDRYQVLLGDSSQLDKKIRSMQEAAVQMSDYQRGTLDVSFTIWPDKVGYTPASE